MTSTANTETVRALAERVAIAETVSALGLYVDQRYWKQLQAHFTVQV